MTFYISGKNRREVHDKANQILNDFGGGEEHRGRGEFEYCLLVKKGEAKKGTSLWRGILTLEFRKSKVKERKKKEV